MRIHWLFVALVGCSEYSVEAEKEVPPPVFPTILVDPVVIDFGEVPYEEHPERSFTITNVGDAPLHLGELTVAGESFSLSDSPSDLELGVDDQVQGTVFFTEGEGEQFGQVEIPSDDPATPVAVIDLHAMPGDPPPPDLLVEPDPVDFGTVEIGADAIRSVSLTNLSDAPLDLTNAVVDEPFWLGLIEPITLAAGESRSMNVHFTPLEPIPYAGELVFTVTQLGEVSVDVIGEGNSTPNAVCAGLPINPIIPMETVTWVGSGSTDPAGRPLTYTWTLLTQPAGSAAVMPAGAAPISRASCPMSSEPMWPSSSSRTILALRTPARLPSSR